jgi:hypothetical protein
MMRRGLVDELRVSSSSSHLLISLQILHSVHLNLAVK